MPLDVLGRTRTTLMYSMQQITASNEGEDRVVAAVVVKRWTVVECRGRRQRSSFEDSGESRA